MASLVIDAVTYVQDSIRNLLKVPSKAPQAPPPLELLYKGPVYVLLAYVGATIFEGVYNIFNHPLAEFPGPNLAAFSSWYQTYYEIYRKESWIDVLERLHKKYGPIVRVGPNELHFSDPAAYHEIYNNDNRWDKDSSLYRSFGQNHSSFGFLKYDQSKKRRDILNPLFSHTAISDLQDLVQSNVDRLCEVLTANNANGKSSDLFLGLRCFTLDTITSFCFAKSIDALGEPDFKSPIIEAMEASLPRYLFFKHFSLIRRIASLMPPWLSALVSPQIAGLTRLKRLLGGQVVEVTSNLHTLLEAPHKIIYQELLSPEVNVDGKVPNAQSLYEEAQTLVFNGTGTTANTLMLGIFNMLENPALMSRLRKELIDAWPALEGAPPKFGELEKLPFLTAVIKESLRIGPGGIVSPLPRVVPKGGATVSGSLIPFDTAVGMAGYFVHNSETIFKDPKEFNPERWLEDAASLEKWLVSFSTGPRMCMGQNLAYCELYLAFASLFRRFDLELDSTRQGTPKQQSRDKSINKYSGHVSDLKWRDCFLPQFEGAHLHTFCRPAVK